MGFFEGPGTFSDPFLEFIVRRAEALFCALQRRNVVNDTDEVTNVSVVVLECGLGGEERVRFSVGNGEGLLRCARHSCFKHFSIAHMKEVCLLLREKIMIGFSDTSLWRNVNQATER